MRISVNADNREYSIQIGPGMIKEEGLFTGFRRAAVVTPRAPYVLVRSVTLRISVCIKTLPFPCFRRL